MKLGINREYVLNIAKELLEFHSPSGFCFKIMEHIRKWAEEFGYDFDTTRKGCGIIIVPGTSKEKERIIVLEV
jgi:putative aminopeptidase FrvX